MTKEELNDLLIKNNLLTKCFLDQTRYIAAPDVCGVYKEEMFYYLYLTDSNANVDIIRRSKDPRPFYDFLANYLGINPHRQSQVLKNTRKNKAYGKR